jgi:MFS family permease
VAGAGAETGDAFAEPETRVGWPWIAAVAAANWGLWAALFGPIQLLLALQAEAIAPADKIAVFGWVSAAGAACSLVANPLSGALSDRTTSRFGRRLPWVALGAVGGAASLVLLSVADGVAVMLIGWCLAQTSLNAMFAALVATVPDKVPVAQRGIAGAWMGVAQTGGIVGGVAIAQLAAPDIARGYLACAAALLVATLPYLLLHGDAKLERAPPFEWKVFLQRFWIDPRRHPDIAWAWSMRFLFNFVASVGMLYLLYFLTDIVRRHDPAGDVLMLTALNVAVLMVVMIPVGIWSDRLRRRKPFVYAAAILLAAGMAMLALIPDWTMILAAVAILGAGFGIYTAVDVAIITQVLPDAADRGRDLGVLNIANSLPQVMVPAIASLIVGLAGYSALYALTAALALCAMLAARQIRSIG